jgi:hypothetical protein
MSDETPTTPQPTPDPTAEQAPVNGTVVDPAEPTAETSGGGAGRKVALGVAGVVAVAAVGGGAYAYTQLSGGGTQPHDVLPADTFAYVRLDLDPSAGQKIDLFRLTKRVPELSKELGIRDEDDDLRKIVLEKALGDCDDVDYDRDVEPWLGERLGLGVGSFENEDEAIRIAVQVKDEDAAKDGIAKLFACGDEEFGLAFLDGYAIVTPTQKTADAAVKAAEEKPLADVASFKDTSGALDEQGVLSGWADIEGGLAAAKEAGLEADLGADETDELEQITDEVSSVAFALSATSTSLRFDAVGRQGDDPTKLPEIRGLGSLPKDTVVGLTLPGGGALVEENWDELKSSLQDLLDIGPALGFVPGLSGVAGPPADQPAVEFDADAYAADPEGYQEEYLKQLEQQYETPAPGTGGGADVDETIAQLEQTLDVTLPEDLVTFLGDAISVYVGREGLDTLTSDAGPSSPADVATGLVLEGDEEKAADLAGRLVAKVKELVGVDIATADGGDAVSLATSTKVADELVKDGGLGDTDLFTSVVKDGNTGGLFVDVGTLLDAIAEAAPDVAQDETFASVRDNLDAVGISGTRPGDGFAGYSLAVAFTEKD